jgi:hypothetical protein
MHHKSSARFAPLTHAIFSLSFLAAGCDRPITSMPVQPGPASSAVVAAPQRAASSEMEVREADFSILFVGNSHTGMHDLPQLIARMIEHRYPGQKVVVQYVPCAFLEDAANNPQCIDEIETRPWKHVVLQAQKISMSGKYNYSRDEGIELASLAKEHGAKAIYYAEWGLKNVAGDGARQAKVYQEMAKESGATVAPIAMAWDLALERKPELKLYSGDGNHQSELGAFLTACVLIGQITGDSPLELAKYPYEHADDAERSFLAQCAEDALKSQKVSAIASEEAAGAKLP